MGFGFNTGGCGCDRTAGVEDVHCGPFDNSFLLLLVLFILLASNVTRGIENNFFFIIILAVIALGGIDKAFGLFR